MKLKVPAIIACHDIDEGIALADEIVLLRAGRIEKTIINPLPRPRSTKTLTSAEHVRCRKDVVDFLNSDVSETEPSSENPEICGKL
jgi:ABC-type nitrate/sulfonate/bicarbonate transport system ATPase subunit